MIDDEFSFLYRSIFDSIEKLFFYRDTFIISQSVVLVDGSTRSFSNLKVFLSNLLALYCT